MPSNMDRIRKLKAKQAAKSPPIPELGIEDLIPEGPTEEVTKPHPVAELAAKQIAGALKKPALRKCCPTPRGQSKHENGCENAEQAKSA